MNLPRSLQFNLDTIAVSFPPHQMPTGIITTIVTGSACSIGSTCLALATPGATDAWALVGALVGTMFTTITSRLAGRQRLHTILVMAASFSIGWILPGFIWMCIVLVHPSAEVYYNQITFHAWMLFGIIGAILGWPVVKFIQGPVTRWFERWSRNKLDDIYSTGPKKDTETSNTDTSRIK